MADPDLRGFDAQTAAALLLVDPVRLGGAQVQAQAGPVRDAWLAQLRALIPQGPAGQPALPLQRLPLHAGEDRLLGGIDLPATLASGRPVLQQGLLAAADGGLLLVSMAERLAGATASHLCAALDQGAVQVEREGLSARVPARVAVLALDESQGDDEPMSPALADRLALRVDLRSLSVHDLPALDPVLAGQVQAARGSVHAVDVPAPLIEALCAATLALGIDSARAGWLAVCAARASAALRGRPVADADDAALAARLVLGPRATRRPPEPADEEPPPPDADEPPPDQPPDTPPAEGDEDTPPPPTSAEMEDRLVEAALAAIPAGLLARLASGERGRDRTRSAGRAGARSASRQRGRPLGARRGAPHAGARLHLIETLRAAAPWQRLRRQQAEALAAVASAQGRAGEGAAGAGASAAAADQGASARAAQAGTRLGGATQAPAPTAGPLVRVRSDDFHIRRFELRRTTTTIFAIDASGSSALYRLAEAKGAVELLLAECYVRRDQVAVITFRGRGAELLLPPTRSLVRAKRGLAGLPGGGGTPLAAGLAAAGMLAEQVRRSGATPVVVVLTDGRANVALDGEGGRSRAQQDALNAARALRQQGGHCLLIDTSARPEPAALALAVAMGARYLALPQADARSLSGAVQAPRR